MLKKWIPVLTAILLLLAVPGLAEQEITSVSQLNAPGMIVGVSQGSAAELTVKAELPQAGMAYFTENNAAYLAVAQGKVDAYVFDLNQMRFAIEQGVSGVRLLEETMGETVQIAVGISPKARIPDIEEKLNRFISEKRADGTLDDMYRRWAIEGNETMPEIALPKNPALHLTVGTSGIVPPFSYYGGTELTGYDIELARRFAAWLGADVQFRVYDYGAIIPAAVAGDIDCVMANLNITPERREAMTFSDILYEEKLGVMVRGDAAAAKEPAWAAYNGKRLGVITGGLMEKIAHTYFPDSEYLYLTGYPDCIAALLAGKIDAYPGDEPGLKTVHAEQPRIDYIRERITNQEYSFAFRKDDPKSAALCEELNAFLALCRADGTIQELDDIWFGADEDRKVVDMSGLTGENGTIRVVTTSTDMPFSYIKDGKNVGYDIDLVVRFCRYAGYQLELGDVDFAARIPAVQSGKFDFSTDMNVTPERQEAVLFSDPTSYGGVVLAVLKAEKPAAAAPDTASIAPAAVREETFWDGLVSSFNKTFIREGRWKLFVNGVIITLLITVLSILLGTALGFFVFLLCRNGNPAANGFSRFSMWLVQGMPMVVLLMILYYIVFGNVAISGIAVAVIGFTLTFGSSVFGLIKMGVGMIDRGQYEAAYALGHTNRHTFFRIILPQAIPHVLPAYKGEIVGLIKATAVVGYIAVQDLTKMGDIVRSRTYEAFFPLIAVTVIYFVLEGIFGFLVSRIRVQIDPKKRSRERILKGVRTDD